VTRRRSEATGREFIALVTVLMASAALAIDLMLPAFTDVRAEYGMEPGSSQVGLLITVFFLGMAIGPWVFGPASDRFGRKPPLYVGLIVYALAGVAAALAPTWPVLVATRFVWGIGTAAPRSLSVAMVRDRYSGDEMARQMATITAVFLLIPIAAPTVGAGLIAVLPWRAVFLFPTLLAIVVMVWARRLPETLSDELRRPFTLRSVGEAGREVLTHRSTVGLTLAMTFLFGTMTTYLAGSEVIVVDVYDLRSWFPLYFGAIAVLLAVSSLNNARLVSRIGAERLVRRMSFGGVVTTALMLVVSLATGGHPPFWVFCLATAAVMPLVQGLSPIANSLAMTPVPHVAGTASALISTVTVAGGSVLGSIANGTFDGTTTPFSIAFVVYVSCAAALIVLVGTRGRGAVGAANVA
jgi:DHA1 family bicyclomycin/chloramphenicol resistance-like MFS transporter